MVFLVNCLRDTSSSSSLSCFDLYSLAIYRLGSFILMQNKISVSRKGVILEVNKDRYSLYSILEARHLWEGTLVRQNLYRAQSFARMTSYERGKKAHGGKALYALRLSIQKCFSP